MTTSVTKASKEKIEQLVERYTKSYLESEGVPGSRARDYLEQDTATKFVKPMIEALGWNMLSMREVREEVSFGEKRIDCVLYSEGKPYVVFEFKSFKSGSLHKVDVSEFIKNAAALGAKYAVLTRFRETIIYDSETGKQIEYFAEPRDYVGKFDVLWKYLSRPSITQ